MRRNWVLALAAVVFLALSAGCEVAQPESAPPTAGSQAPLTQLNDRGQLQLFSGTFATTGDDVEGAARSFLASRAKEFRLDVPGLTLVKAAQKVGLAGTYVRFEQHQLGLPVFGGEVIVLVQGQPGAFVVRAVNLSQQDDAAGLALGEQKPAAEALTRGLALLGIDVPDVAPEVVTGVLVSDGVARVVHRVRVAVTHEPLHDWEVMLDAATLAEVSRRDRIESVDGTGLVFDANPVASTGNTSFVDGNNATTPALDAARFSVTLPRLDGSGFLRGPWVDSRTNNAASRATSPTNTFSYDRSMIGFEQTNIYYHLDRAQSRIQALGFTNANNRQQVALADGTTQDNSFFTPSTLIISYGTGGVDDAEDSEVTVHEYGHATQHDQVATWATGGDEGSMGEGFGDYLAASVAAVMAPDAGHPQLTDVYCVADWDAVSYATGTPKCLRRLDSSKHWPEAIANEVHADGEMWSAGTWGVRELLGPDIADKLIIEAHFLMGGSATFAVAATAMQTVDQTLYGGVHVDAIRRRMIKQGLSRQLSNPPAGGVISSLTASIDNPRVGSTYAANLDDTKTYTVPGAAGLIVHFSTLTTQLSSDNIYLTNGVGDLFQVINGSKTNYSANAVVGDTVNIRLVTNGSTNAFGYHVDRIDVVGMLPDGGVPDGGVVPMDGGLVVVDAGSPDAGTRTDAGTTTTDAGTRTVAGTTTDAGMTTTDAGMTTTDAGTTTTDAGMTTDAGQPVQNTVYVPLARDEVGKVPGTATGCGCSTGSPADLWLLAPALGLLLRRRRTFTHT
jgi:MYXO-CTERM domain-containing protein